MTDINKRAMEILMTTTGADEAELAAAMTEPDHPDNTVDVLDAIAAVEAAMREPVRVTDEMVRLAEEARENTARKVASYGSAGIEERYLMAMRAALEAALGQGKANAD